MSIITRQDTNGVKPLLQVGEFGYDNYPAGGDVGRVYIGTGSENIPLAKKAEMLAVDVHFARVDNPHGVTKAQVGLGNADNTADIDKIVASAGRLTAGKKINNVVFDNTQDITIKSETPNKVIVKFDGGTTEGADIYTFDGSEAKSVDIIAGINVQLVKTPGSVTINVDDIDASKITSGVIDAARLPSYVDDVLEFSSFDDFPLAGETGKIYVALDTNKTYRWGGTAYVYITSGGGGGGAVDSVAGKTGAVILNKNDVGLSNVDNTSDANKPVSTATQSSLNLKANDNVVVKLTGDQTVAGIKTFNSSPIVPTPTTDTQAANKNYVDSKTLNINSLTDKPTPINTDKFVLQEVGGNLKKVSYENLIISTNAIAVKTALNASGTAPIYACRAWVNFNGNGTVAIRASGNVSSITDNGVGNYTVNFYTNMIDSNYSLSGICKASSSGAFDGYDIISKSTTSFTVRTVDTSTNLRDPEYTDLQVFR